MIKNFISGSWIQGDSDRVIENLDPSTGSPYTAWTAASELQVDQAVTAARSAYLHWANRPHAERQQLVERYAEVVSANLDELAGAIQAEAGKPLWEALQEAKAVAGKVSLSIKAYQQRCSSFGNAPSRVRFRAHGVLAVIGPFNFPAHLPNGHIVPALLAGNTVVFKPSERVPLAAQLMARYWHEAGLPEGAFNIVQGDGLTGATLADHPDIDGLLFTGGSKLGEQFRQSFAGKPEKLLALELGGNNPLVVWDSTDVDAAVSLILQSAYVTAGQRCTCARRLILPNNDYSKTLTISLLEALDQLRVGSAYAMPEVFMGPVIAASESTKLQKKQDELKGAGAKILRPLRILKADTGLVSPGLIDTTGVSEVRDEELFGPLLQVRRVDTFEDAIVEANNTRYGLAAGLVSNSPERYEQFRNQVNAGIINWNKPLTGASGAAPFGGIGLSGNHRPSGFFAADYCSYAVASLESPELEHGPTPPGHRPNS